MPELDPRICWNKDGRRLVMRVIMCSRDNTKKSQHIMMVQLGAPKWGIFRF